MFQKTLSNDSATACGAMMFHAAYNVQQPAEGAADRRAERALASVIRTILLGSLEPHSTFPAARIGAAIYGAALEALRGVDQDSKRGNALTWAKDKLQEVQWAKLGAGALMAQILVFDGPLQDDGKSAFYMHLDPAVCEDVGQLKKKDVTPLKLKAELQGAYPKAAIIYR
jgi:hypothetical protein